MRDAFSTTLVELAKADPKVLLITGDHGYALFDEFRRECPDQYINAGIAEQNMVGMAAGLARLGFRPFVYGLSAFVPVRVLEQVKLDIAHDCLPVVLLGDGAGFVYSHLGTSHQSTEDIACTRALPSLSVLSPADAQEMAACLKWAYQSGSSVYLRMGKADKGPIHTDAQKVDVSKIINIYDGKSDIVIIATGSMVKTALELTKRGLVASVWSAPTLKPFDATTLISIAERHEYVITLEEHSIFGGLGSIVSEILGEHLPRKIKIFGVKDRFSKRCGSYDYLLKEHGLDLENIEREILLSLKNQ